MAAGSRRTTSRGGSKGSRASGSRRSSGGAGSPPAITPGTLRSILGIVLLVAGAIVLIADRKSTRLNSSHT